MPLIKIGSCNNCGRCCLREGGLMVENPMIALDEDRCKFYVDKLNTQKYGHCLIFGRGNKPITAVKDRYGNKITPEQIRWHKDNCPNFPTIEDAQKGYPPPAYCSIKIVEVVIDG